MKTVHLLRHAKSSWAEAGIGDRDRGLNHRGQRDAPRMGAALSRLIPAMTIASSPARRALLTLDGLCERWPGLADYEHRIEDALYTFDSDDLLQWISHQDDAQHSLFVIGHNPALTDLINDLCPPPQLANLPTAGYARLLADANRWQQLAHCPVQLETSLFPRHLGDR